MKRKFILILILMSITFMSYPQFKQVTSSYIGGSSDENLVSAAVMDNGDIVVIGNTSSETINGTSVNVFGTQLSTDEPSGFIMILNNDGTQIKNISKFPNGVTKLHNVAVNQNGIYITGSATQDLKMFINSHFVDSVSPVVQARTESDLKDVIDGGKPGFKYFIARVSLDGNSVMDASYLTGNAQQLYGYSATDSSSKFSLERDEIGIDLFSNGDIVVNTSVGMFQRWDGIARIKYDLSDFVWHKDSIRVQGAGGENLNGDAEPNVVGARTYDVAISPDEQYIYSGGYGMGYTGQEPYKDPFAFKFSANDGTQLWYRGDNGSDDFAIYNFEQYEIGDNRRISDSQIRSVDVDSSGFPLITGYTDGGASVLIDNPWSGEGTDAIQDGPVFASMGGASSASIVGKLKTDGSSWVYSHRFRPEGYAYHNKHNCVMSMAGDKILLTGYGGNIASKNSWYVGSGAGDIVILDIDETGTTRLFVQHITGVDEFFFSARNPGSARYVVVGEASSSGAETTSNALSSSPFGGEDGYLVVFDDTTQVFPLSAEAQVTDASVAGGTDGAISLTVSGGENPYSFNWSNGASTKDISGLIAGEYSVTITDNAGDQVMESWFVDQPSAIILDTTITHVSCNGLADGAIQLSASGGTTPYTYNWSTGDNTSDISGLSAGTYFVTVEDDGSEINVEDFVINEPDTMSISSNITSASCESCSDGSISLTLSGGTPSYNYTWSNSGSSSEITSLLPDVYDVTITDDNGCTKDASFEVPFSNVFAKVNFQTSDFTTPADYLADDGDAYGDRGNGFIYGWDATNEETRNRDFDPDSLFRTFNHMQLDNSEFYWEISVPNGDYQLDIGCGDADYTDQTNDLNIEGTIVSDMDGEDNFDEFTKINVTVDDGRLTIKPASTADNAKICFVDIYSMSFTPVQVKNTMKKDIRVYPSITEGIVNIEGLKKQSSAKIISITGKYHGIYPVENGSVNISGLNDGLYFLILNTDYGRVTFKVIKQ